MISQILGGLLAAAVGFVFTAAAYAALQRVRRRLYPTQPPPPYAAFETVPVGFAPAPPGRHVRLVEALHCHGTCGGRRPHENDGSGTATCVPCGTPRPTTDTTEQDQPHAS